jgi:hypothetical protein
MHRTVVLLFPNGETQYWFTERLFTAGDRLDRNGQAWIVSSVGAPDKDGRHTNMTLRPAEDSSLTIGSRLRRSQERVPG